MSAPQPQPVLHYLRRVLGPGGGEGVGDADLLRRFAATRDEAAFELLVWRHAAMVRRVCRHVLRDEHAAEDAFQATFLTLARRAGSAGRRGAVGAWLYRVAFRAALKARERSARAAAREAFHAAEVAARAAGQPVEEAAATRELAPLLHAEVDRLASRYRLPVVLCYFEGKTHAEAARALGWATGTVAGRLARARALLRARLTRRGVALPAGALGIVFAAEAAQAVTPPAAAALAAAAAAYAAGKLPGSPISAHAIQLTRGVLNAMFLSNVKTAALGLAAAGLVAAGAWSGWVRAQGRAGQEAGGAGGGFGGAPQVQRAARPEVPGARNQPDDAEREARARFASKQNLKMIGLAFHNYHDTYGRFPADITDANGRPLLSWRVALLPFFEGDTLYKEFHLDEPWDSPHNKPLAANVLKVYRVETQRPGDSRTYYQGFFGGGAFFDPPGEMAGGGGGVGMPGMPGMGAGPGGMGGRMGGPPGMPGFRGMMGPGGGAAPGMPGGPGGPGGGFPGGPASGAPGGTPAGGGEGGQPGGTPTGGGASGPAGGMGMMAGMMGGMGAGMPGVRRSIVRIGDITDGTSNTILLVEAGDPVPWSKPADLPYAPNKRLPRLGGAFPDVIHALFADGSVHDLRPDFDERILRAAITRAGGEVVDLTELHAVPDRPGIDPDKLRGENEQLHAELRRATDESRKLKDEVARLRERADAKRQQQMESEKLLGEQETLRRKIEATQAEVQRLRDEAERLRRAADR